MITNERQYRITRNKAGGFARAIEEFDAKAHERTGVHPRLVQAEREAMESQLADLQEGTRGIRAAKVGRPVCHFGGLVRRPRGRSDQGQDRGGA